MGPVQSNYRSFSNQIGGYTGNPAQNLTEIQEVQQELRRRHGSQKGRPAQQTAYAVIDDQNMTRLFKPLLPMDHWVHPDDHIEWLKGRTRAVCRKLAWAKTET